jgi:HEPN domain-containing protein
MNRKDLQKLTRIRLREARTLFRAGRYDGAYYLAGYTVECALKACIAKRTRRSDFPDRELAKKVFVHDLKQLRTIAELNNKFNEDIGLIPGLEKSWNLVSQWDEKSRYLYGTTKTTASDVLNAVANKSGGVLPWLEKYW